MTGIVLSQFGGMVPRLGDQLLQNQNASFAENTLLLSGELRGIPLRTRLVSLDPGFDIRRIYRVFFNGSNEWLPFADETIDMVRAPLVNDSFQRIYYTSENGAPRMNTIQRMIDGQPGYLLGVPAPENTPVVTVTGGTGDDVTRAYVYTFVSFYNEEGPPSLAVVESGPTNGTWTISNMDTTVPDASERNIIKKRLYRTVTGSSGTVEYHYVRDVDLAAATAEDTESVNDVAVRFTLQSEFYEAPPTDLVGLVAHPNGFLLGFVGRDMYMSEPYRPHAWPNKYTLATEDDIRGLGVFTTSVGVCTTGFPYIATGIHPASITLTKAQTPNPCVSSRRGIVPTIFGVYYPADDGLTLMSAAGFTNATQPLMTRSEWFRDYTPSELNAVRWQSQYVAFHTVQEGFMFSPDEPIAAFIELKDRDEHVLIQNDTVSGDVFMVEDNVVYEWNPTAGLPNSYVWRSKEFVTPRPVNFGAFAVEFGAPIEIPPEVIEDFGEFNEERFKYPLNPINWHALNEVKTLRNILWLEDTDPLDPPLDVENSHKQPFHASSLFSLDGYPTTSSTALKSRATNQRNVAPAPSDTTYEGDLQVTLFADGVEIYSQAIKDEDQYKLPTGYKARRWYVELRGTIPVRSFKMAETGKELAGM